MPTIYIILGSFCTFLRELCALSYHLYAYSWFILGYGCLMMFAEVWTILTQNFTLIWMYFDPQMAMRCYARGAREEQKFDSSQDHSPTMVLATDHRELCNCGLFVFSSAVWLWIVKFLCKPIPPQQNKESIA